jgi:hypothetical protein
VRGFIECRDHDRDRHGSSLANRTRPAPAQAIERAGLHGPSIRAAPWDIPGMRGAPN